MKIAVFLPNWIGDAVMATPALRAIRTAFPRAEIVGVLRPYVAGVLDGLDLTDRLVLHHPRGSEPSQHGWRFIRRLRRECFDVAVLFPNSLRSAWLAWAAGAKRRIGFDRDGRGWLLTDRIPPKPKSVPHPVIDEYLRLAAHLISSQASPWTAEAWSGGDRSVESISGSLPPHPNPPPRDGRESEWQQHRDWINRVLTSRRMELAVTDEDQCQYEAFWSLHDERLRQKGIVCLNPGGAFGSAKHWPTSSFAELARRIATELNKAVLVLCGPAERDEARNIVMQAGHRSVVTLADVPLSLGLTKAAIKHAELLVTTDSGPRHFAPPFGVPVVTLFGPTHIAWSETFYDRAIHLQLPVDCGPCQQRVCPLGHHRCLRDLRVEQVFEAVVNALHPSVASRAA